MQNEGIFPEIYSSLYITDVNESENWLINNQASPLINILTAGNCIVTVDTRIWYIPHVTFTVAQYTDNSLHFDMFIITQCWPFWVVKYTLYMDRVWQGNYWSFPTRLTPPTIGILYREQFSVTYKIGIINMYFLWLY